MKIAASFQSLKPVLSYELFPPKTETALQGLYEHVLQLMAFKPSFITCTYGAGGSTRNKTLEVITEVRRRFDVTVASHLTLVGSTIDDLRQYLTEAKEAGIDGIVALRGDPPKDSPQFRMTPGGFQFANQLVELLSREFPEFSVLVAGYPETHREAPNLEVDLDNLKRKVDAGSDVIVTQLFFDNQDFFRFRDRCWARGITIPIVPGILPAQSAEQLNRLGQLCGAKMPADLLKRLSLQPDSEGQAAIGVDFATQQVRELIDADVPGIHFYVLNQSRATKQVLTNLGFEQHVVGSAT
ncbi:MAG: methylenetetrahydrofolate reductase [NAD(P)H] [Planctomycetaceae bacterium]|jgi:methylenetetrahydrofolate reductase (NADPH)|nr:methylenetetrahydrofolate reductase [NAD(P)H] [Planctomycetaceae bacterium]